MNRNLRRAGLTVAIAALVAAGCSDDEDDDAAVTTTEPAAEEAGTESFEITAVNYAFEGVPANMAAGSRLALTNASDDEVHEIVAMRIPDDEHRPVAELVELPEVEQASLFPPGPPEAVLIAPPGEDGFAAVGDGTIAEPGRYALMCFVPTGADPEEYLDPANRSEDGPPDVAGGPPHVANGMFAELAVE